CFSCCVLACDLLSYVLSLFFFHDPATSDIYTLSLHDALPILGRPFVWIMRWNRFHISVSLSISHSFVHTNSSSTCTSSCFPSCLHNFTSSFTCHSCTCTGYFRTSISTSHCLPS